MPGALLAQLSERDLSPRMQASSAKSGELDLNASAAPYFLKLVDDYGIWSRENPSKDWGRLALVRRTGPYGGIEIVFNLRRYAVHGHTILGTTSKGYFVFDTTESSHKAEEFESRGEWIGYMSKLKVPLDIELRNPDLDITTRPAKELHPWNYIWFHGPFDLTDQDVGFDLLFGALMLSAVLGILFGNRLLLGVIPFMAGAAAGFVIQFVADAMCCFILFAPMCYGVYRLTAGIRGFFLNRGKKDASGQGDVGDPNA